MSLSSSAIIIHLYGKRCQERNEGGFYGRDGEIPRMNADIYQPLVQIVREQPDAELTRWVRRADLQLAFARVFTDALPTEQTQGWSEQIAEAERCLTAADPEKGIAGLKTALQAAEKAMAGIGKAAKAYKIHCVGHGHIDMNWMWSWPETVATTHDTFASALRLMHQYPDFTFSQSQASVYALVEKYYPAMFTEIQERVKEGRWEITAAHWVEGEKNIASGESLCRHLLYTRRYFQDKFGLSPEDLPVDWEPDTFGHAVTVPGILARGAVKYYYSCRQGGGFDHVRIGNTRPRLFWWQGPDGSRILVNLESTWYNSEARLSDNIALALVGFAQETGLHDWLNVYGVGNHGGGPTRTEIDFFIQMQDWPIYPQVVFSTSKRFFDTIAEELRRMPDNSLPTIAHELNFEFTGCYTTQTLIKQANRFGENYLEEAETLAALASQLTGLKSASLRDAWILVLFNQFHDILPGSGVRETREHAMAAFQEVGAITGAIKRQAGAALTGRIDTLSLLPETWDGRQEKARIERGDAGAAFEAGAGLGAGQTGISGSRGGGKRFRPYVVYNPCAWPRSERVTVPLYDTGFDAARIVALDETGTANPTICVEEASGWAAWGHSRLTMAFDAQDIPALGYRTYLLCEGEAKPPSQAIQVRPQDWFETPFLKFRLDREQGGLGELWDKRTGACLTGSANCPLGAWAFVTERPRGMTAWTLGREVAAPLTLVSSSFDVRPSAVNGGTGVREAVSPIGAQAVWHLAVPGTKSAVKLTLMIHALEPRLDFEAEIDWREIGDPERGIPGLTIRFPLALAGVKTRYEAPFGSVERSLFGGEEVPALRYAHLSGQARAADGEETTAGVTLLQDCKYGHSVHATEDGTELRLRIVRSSFDPDPTPEVAKHTVRYSLYLHDTPADPASLARLGAAWNHPLIPFAADFHGGEAKPKHGFAQVQTPNVALTAFKPAEDGLGLVLRLVELNGQATEAVVELDAKIVSGLTQARQLDLMERPTSGTVLWENGTLRVSVPAHGIITIGLS